MNRALTRFNPFGGLSGRDATVALAFVAVAVAMQMFFPDMASATGSGGSVTFANKMTGGVNNITANIQAFAKPIGALFLVIGGFVWVTQGADGGKKLFGQVFVGIAVIVLGVDIYNSFKFSGTLF